MKYIKLTILFLALYSAGFTQSADDSVRHKGLSELIRSASEYNSKLSPVELQRKIEMIKSGQNNRQPMPMFEAMIDFIPLDFMGKPEYSGFYSQRLMLPSKLEQNELSGIIKSKRQEIVKSQLKLTLERDVKLNYFNLYLAERKLSFNTEYSRIVRNIIQSLEASYASGMGTQSRILKMNSELQMLEYENIELGKQKDIYINNLSTLANIPLPVDFATKGIKELFVSPPVLDTVLLVKYMADNNPEFRMIRNMEEENNIERNMAELDKIPDLTLRGGVRYMAREPMTFVMFSAGIDLPFMPWNRKSIDAKLEEKDYVDKQLNSANASAYQYMRTELLNMITMAGLASEKMTYLRDVLIPLAQQTFNSDIVSYSAGKGEFMDLLDSFRQMRESDQMLIDVEAEYLKQLSEIEFISAVKLMNVK